MPGPILAISVQPAPSRIQSQDQDSELSNRPATAMAPRRFSSTSGLRMISVPARSAALTNARPAARFWLNSPPFTRTAPEPLLIMPFKLPNERQPLRVTSVDLYRQKPSRRLALDIKAVDRAVAVEQRALARCAAFDIMNQDSLVHRADGGAALNADHAGRVRLIGGVAVDREVRKGGAGDMELAVGRDDAGLVRHPCGGRENRAPDAGPLQAPAVPAAT